MDRRLSTASYYLTLAYFGCVEFGDMVAISLEDKVAYVIRNGVVTDSFDLADLKYLSEKAHQIIENLNNDY